MPCLPERNGAHRPGCSPLLLKPEKMRSKGAAVAGGFLARGQARHLAPRMTGQFPGRPDAADPTRAQRFAVAATGQVSAGRSGSLPESRPDAPKPGWGLRDSLALTTSDTLLRLLMPEPKPDPAKCEQCGWCVYECPMDDITLRQAQGRPLQSHPVLRHRCIRAYHCLTICPQQGFDVNWFSPTFFFRFSTTPPSCVGLANWT